MAVKFTATRPFLKHKIFECERCQMFRHAYASNNWIDREISFDDALRIHYKFWKGEMNMAKDWSTIWIGCCTIVNSALLTLRLNHSRQIQRSVRFSEKSLAHRSSGHIGPRSETCASFHTEDILLVLDILSVFYIFRGNKHFQLFQLK